MTWDIEDNGNYVETLSGDILDTETDNTDTDDTDDLTLWMFHSH